MAKLQSSFKNMLLSLTLIALVAAGLLAGANMLTKDAIEKAKADKLAASKLDVLPQLKNISVAEEGEDVNGLIIYKARVGEELVGAAVEVKENGFGGEFKLMVGFDAAGTITGYQVLEHQETPGLGSKMQEWFSTEKNKQNVKGLNPGNVNLTVSKDGGDVDAITAATISSRAFLLAVQKAYNAYLSNMLDANSGATTLNAVEASEAEIASYENGEEAAPAEEVESVNMED